MPILKRCDPSVNDLAATILFKFETYQPIINAKVTVDYLFAFAERDEAGEKKGPALKLHGVAALGICRVTNYKDRVKGMADVEISLDGDWWEESSDEEKAALVDHELHHIDLVLDQNGNVKRDDLNRPMITMRKHDSQFGWFAVIAARHGPASQEQQQAKAIVDVYGEYYLPGLAPLIKKANLKK